MKQSSQGEKDSSALIFILLISNYRKQQISGLLAYNYQASQYSIFKLQLMYGKLNERKLRDKDFELSCEQARNGLDQYIDIQNRRVNVDSAKKLAVMQHMDYEGFRQMVLGANIFPTKSKQLYQFSKGDQPLSMNSNKAYDLKKDNQSNVDIQKGVQSNSEKYCNNFRDFKKKWLKFYEKELSWGTAEECYSLVKEQNKDRLQKIFNLECEADILVKIAEVFAFVIAFLKQSDNESNLLAETGYIVKLLQTVLSIPTMQDISIKILTKKQRDRIIVLLQECKNVLQDDTAIDVISLLKK